MRVSELKQQISGVLADRSMLQEIRIRAGRPIMVQVDGREQKLEMIATTRLIQNLMEQFSRHSLYAYEEEIRQGFLTIEGGHRVGIVGKVVLDSDRIRTIKYISGLNIRLSHECKGCADSVVPWLYKDNHVLNTILISPPGAGKTTLLRDMVRQISDGNGENPGVSVSVVDERSEIGACDHGIPQCDLGIRTDVLDGCPKALGMNLVLRSMNPSVIAVDEIGTRADFEALREAMKCGCRILATVHGDSVEDLKQKPIMKEMIMEQMFERYVVLGRVPRPGIVKGVYGRSFERLC